MIPNYEISLMGENGVTCIVPGTGPITGKYFCIQLLEDSSLSTISGNVSGVANLTGVSLVAGNAIFGMYTVVGLVSGRALVYNR